MPTKTLFNCIEDGERNWDILRCSSAKCTAAACRVNDAMWGTFKRKALVPNILLLLKALCDALLAVRLAQECRSPFGYSEDIIAQACMFTLIIWHNCEVKTVSASRVLQFMIY